MTGDDVHQDQQREMDELRDQMPVRDWDQVLQEQHERKRKRI